MGGKLGKSEKSSLAGVDFGKFPQGCGGRISREKGPKKTPTALFRVVRCLLAMLLSSDHYP